MTDEDKQDVSLLPQQRAIGGDENKRSTDLPADAPWWARWLVANFEEGWKWLSVQWPIICVGLVEFYGLYRDEIGAYIPESWAVHVAAAAFMLNALLRFVNQTKPKP